MSDLRRNHLVNGRFLHDLDGWTASGASYSAGDGDDHYGVAVLSGSGGYVAQPFSVSKARSYTIALAVRAVNAALVSGDAEMVIVDGSGNAVVTSDLTAETADTWAANTFSVGLAPGGSYTLKFVNNRAGDDVKVDDVWVWWVPMTRAEIATRIHHKLGALATDKSLSMTPAGDLTEGDYTYAIDGALRQVGAIDEESDLPNVRWLEAAMLDFVFEAVEINMLMRLNNEYATDVDINLGPLSESRSQIARQLAMRTGKTSNQPGSRKISQRRLRYNFPDFKAGRRG